MNSSARSRPCDEACSDEQVFVGLDAEPSAAKKLNALMALLAASWFYGKWRAETHTERHMQAMLEDAGWWPIADEAALFKLLDERVPS